MWCHASFLNNKKLPLSRLWTSTCAPSCSNTLHVSWFQTFLHYVKKYSNVQLNLKMDNILEARGWRKAKQEGGRWPACTWAYLKMQQNVLTAQRCMSCAGCARAWISVSGHAATFLVVTNLPALSNVWVACGPAHAGHAPSSEIVFEKCSVRGNAQAISGSYWPNFTNNG